jgi:hypothetical protein
VDHANFGDFIMQLIVPSFDGHHCKLLEYREWQRPCLANMRRVLYRESKERNYYEQRGEMNEEESSKFIFYFGGGHDNDYRSLCLHNKNCFFLRNINNSFPNKLNNTSFSV